MFHEFGGDGLDVSEVGGVVRIFDFLLFLLDESVDIGSSSVH